MAEFEFIASAWVIGDSFQTHDINTDHHGILSDLRVAITEDIGPYPAFTPIHWMLVDFVERIQALEDHDRVRASFAADSWIAASGTYGSGILYAAATVRKAPMPTGTFTANAVLIRGGSFTVDSYIFGGITLDAFLIGNW